MIVALRITISGRVQGVGFRAFVTRRARTHGVRGWVRNRQDGSVEALVIGEETAVVAVVEHCRRGPSLSRVDQVDADTAQDDGSIDFIERATV